jgi:hypothetical protein
VSRPAAVGRLAAPPTGVGCEITVLGEDADLRDSPEEVTKRYSSGAEAQIWL